MELLINISPRPNASKEIQKNCRPIDPNVMRSHVLILKYRYYRPYNKNIVS
jgi:hypothetical protein